DQVHVVETGGVECVFGASGLDDVDLVAAGEGGSALDDFDPGPDEALVDVVGLRIGQGQDPLVHGLEVGGDPTHIGLADLSVRDPNSQTVGAADVVHHLGGGDEGLRGHHIGEHGGAA